MPDPGRTNSLVGESDRRQRSQTISSSKTESHHFDGNTSRFDKPRGADLRDSTYYRPDSIVSKDHGIDSQRLALEGSSPNSNTPSTSTLSTSQGLSFAHLRRNAMSQGIPAEDYRYRTGQLTQRELMEQAPRSSGVPATTRLPGFTAAVSIADNHTSFNQAAIDGSRSERGSQTWLAHDPALKRDGYP